MELVWFSLTGIIDMIIETMVPVIMSGSIAIAETGCKVVRAGTVTALTALITTGEITGRLFADMVVRVTGAVSIAGVMQ